MSESSRRSLGGLLARSRRGAVAVEAAVVIPIMIVLMMAVVDFGRFFYAQVVSSQAANEASRALALGQTAGFSQTVALNLMGGVPTMAGGSATVSSVECPQDVVLDGSQLARVTVSFSFSWLTPFGLLASGTSPVLPAGITQTAESVCRS